MARKSRKINPIETTQRQPEEPRIRTAGYARRSVQDIRQGDKNSLENQCGMIRSYIESNPDMSFCGVYVDNGITGTDFDRPAFDRMFREIQSGNIDCVVVKDFSRFGRNYKECGNLIERIFPALNIRMISINDYYDSENQADQGSDLTVPLRNIMNELYSRDLSQKIHSTLQIKQQKGEYLGDWAPYGYQKSSDNPGKLEINPETAPVVARIFQQRLQGKGYLSIARDLNDRAILSPYSYLAHQGVIQSKRLLDAKWGPWSIRSILENEVYIGHLTQGKTKKFFYQSQEKQKQPRFKWIRCEYVHDPIVTDAVFEEVQRINREAREQYTSRCSMAGQSEHNMFRGRIFCAGCKKPMFRRKSVTKNGGKTAFFFICSTHHANPILCPKTSIKEQELLEILESIVRKQIEMAIKWDQMLREVCKAPAAHQLAEVSREILTLSGRIEQGEKRLEALYFRYVDGSMEEKEYKELKISYKKELEGWKRRLNTLKNKRISIQKNPFAGRPRESTSPTITSELLLQLIQRIEIGADRTVAVYFAFQEASAQATARSEAGQPNDSGCFL